MNESNDRITSSNEGGNGREGVVRRDLLKKKSVI